MNKKVYFSKEELYKVFNFANQMINNHRNNFIDKEVVEKRTNFEIFYNVIQGKLGEIAVRNYIKNKYKDKANIVKDIDWGVYPIGKWDDGDLQVNNSHLSIKTTKYKSVVLMIERDRFDDNGNYKYKEKVDFYIMVGVEPQVCEDDMKDFESFFNKNKNLYAIIFGMISHKDFWTNKKILPRGTIITVRNMNDYLINNKSLIELPDKKGVKLLANNYAIHKSLLQNF